MKPSCSRKSTLELRVNKNREELVRSEESAQESESSAADARDNYPLDLSFWSFLTFLHHGIEEVERHLL